MMRVAISKISSSKSYLTIKNFHSAFQQKRREFIKLYGEINRYGITTWKVSDFVGREDLNVSGWHQYSQHFIAGFSFGKIPLT
jgi:hypothetical protein